MSELTKARAEASARRAQLIGTAHALQERLKPAVIASDAVETAKRRGEALAEEAVAVVKRRPVAFSAAAAGVTALLGFRLFNRFKTSEDDGDE